MASERRPEKTPARRHRSRRLVACTFRLFSLSHREETQETSIPSSLPPSKPKAIPYPGWLDSRHIETAVCAFHGIYPHTPSSSCWVKPLFFERTRPSDIRRRNLKAMSYKYIFILKHINIRDAWDKTMEIAIEF